jgi:hypothetical protein
MYLLKIKGAGKLPDYVQIRDNEFNLTAFVNLTGIEKGLKKNNLWDYRDIILEKLKQADFNEVIFIEEKQ